VGAFVRSAPCALLLALLACGGAPNEPPDPVPPVARPLVVGDTVVATFTDADSLILYTIRSAEPLEFAVFIKTEQNEFLELTVRDSTTGEVLALTGAGDDLDAPDNLNLRRTGILRVEPGDVVLLEARSYPNDRTGRLVLWPYRIDRAPETRPDAMAVGAILEGEELDNSADIDEFTVQGTAGEEWILFLQGLGGVIPGTLIASVYPPAGEESIEETTVLIAGAELESHASGRFVLPADGGYRIEVRQRGEQGEGVRTGVGSFRMLIRRIDRRPEVGPALLTPGDTLEGEAIEFVGDIDEFEVPLIADSVYNLFVHKGHSVTPASVRATITLGGGQVLEVTSSVGDRELATSYTGMFTAPATENTRVRVAGADDDTGLHRGPYRVFVYPVNRAPEIAPPGLALGDSVLESIEYPGDIDRFQVAPPSGGAVELVLRLFDPQDGGILLRWDQNSAGVLNCFPIPGGTEVRCASGPIETADALELTVESQLEFGNPFRGEYQLIAAPPD
jgi:hypothetical protein